MASAVCGVDLGVGQDAKLATEARVFFVVAHGS